MDTDGHRYQEDEAAAEHDEALEVKAALSGDARKNGEMAICSLANLSVCVVIWAGLIVVPLALFKWGAGLWLIGWVPLALVAAGYLTQYALSPFINTLVARIFDRRSQRRRSKR